MTSRSPLVVISLVAAAISIVAAGYGVAVTVPELDKLEDLDSARYFELIDQTFYEALTAWGAGFVAVLTGVIAATRGKQKLGWAGVAGGVVGAGLAFLLIQ